jgi:hypothetical protein
MLFTQTTPISHALPMHQTHRTQLTLLLQNVSIYLHHMHITILILERININMDPFFNSPTSLVLLCWIYQIYWMWLLISSPTSLIHPHSCSCCSTSTQRKILLALQQKTTFSPSVSSPSLVSSSAFLLTLQNRPTS